MSTDQASIRTWISRPWSSPTLQCVKTRHSLALVSKLWRDASKTAAAYPRVFDFDAFRSGERITLGR